MSIGLKIVNPSNTVILDETSRQPIFVAQGTTSSIAAGSFQDITITNMTNTAAWVVIVTAVLEGTSAVEYMNVKYNVVKNTGSFRINNTSTTNAMTFSYVVLRK